MYGLMDFGKGKFLRSDPLEHRIVDWKTAYEVEKLMGTAVEFRKYPQNFTAALPVFSPNSSFKNLAASVKGKLIRHAVPCWTTV
jgi:hypothetical protein